MPDYGFAIVATDSSFVPGPGALEELEQHLKQLQVIGSRLPKVHPDTKVVRWSVGPRAGAYLKGAPSEVGIYLGEPTPFFDGHEVKANPRFILEVENGDPSALTPVLEAVLQTKLETHPYRL